MQVRVVLGDLAGDAIGGGRAGVTAADQACAGDRHDDERHRQAAETPSHREGNAAQVSELRRSNALIESGCPSGASKKRRLTHS
jgi:hypothetical protein